MITNLFIVAMGGAIGTALRFLINAATIQFKIFNIAAGTLLVNLSGSYFIGVLFAFLLKNPNFTSLKFFFATGLLGGFTTFSAYSLENMQLIKDGDMKNALLNILTQNILGILLAYFGYLTGRALQ